LNPGPPALVASAIPLGYRGGRVSCGDTWSTPPSMYLLQANCVNVIESM